MIAAAYGLAIEADPAGLRCRELADGQDRIEVREVMAGHGTPVQQSQCVSNT